MTKGGYPMAAYEEMDNALHEKSKQKASENRRFYENRQKISTSNVEKSLNISTWRTNYG